MIDTTPEGPTPEIELPATDALADRWQDGYDFAARRTIEYFAATGRQALATEIRTVMDELTVGMPDDPEHHDDEPHDPMTLTDLRRTLDDLLTAAPNALTWPVLLADVTDTGEGRLWQPVDVDLVDGDDDSQWVCIDVREADLS